MLQENKPDIEWYAKGGLEEMFFCLYQCDREGEDPEDHVLEHRVPLVRKILADERLKNCRGFVSYQATEGMPYAKLRKHAIFLKLQVLKWMDGRVYDRREQRKARKGMRWEVVVKSRNKGAKPKSLVGTSRNELSSMLCKLESFMSREDQGCDLSHQVFDALRDEVWAIVKDERFRSYYWHTTSDVTLCCELSERVEQARGSIRIILREREAKPKKRTKGARRAKAKTAKVKRKASHR